MPRFTKPPWKSFREVSNRGQKPSVCYEVCQVGARGGRISVVARTPRRVGRTKDATDEATVRLIAAAPELLEACEEALEFIMNGIEFGYVQMPEPKTPDPAHKVPGKLRAVLAKAKGESHD